MATMKKEGARLAIVSEYDRWAKKHPDEAIMMGGFLFFRYLQNERPDLLDFRGVGDKWQNRSRLAAGSVGRHQRRRHLIATVLPQNLRRWWPSWFFAVV
jgi:hypothetical protein